MSTNLDLTKFDFPKPSGVDFAFSTYKTIPALKDEAKLRGFYSSHNPYCALFSKLFFNGGRVKFRTDVDEEYRKRVWSYVRSFMGSFEPSHEDKEAISAMLMSEVIEPELEKATD